LLRLLGEHRSMAVETVEIDRGGHPRSAAPQAVSDGRPPRTLIICVSLAHGSTRRVADEIADELGARVVEPHDVSPAEVETYDVVGFGSGIYAMSFHHHLLDLVRELRPRRGASAFLFATRGGPSATTWLYMPAMNRLLRSTGFTVVGTFSCPGLDTSLPIPFVGGLNKGRPNAADLAAARAFAASLGVSKRVVA
jgi:flavodoxin